MSKKIEEMEGAELDYWIAKSEGLECVISRYHPAYGDDYEDPICWAKLPNSERAGICEWDKYSPSTDWCQGGQILAQHGCSISAPAEGGWSVYDDNTGQWYWDNELLVAGMRAYVASVYGEEVPDGEA